MARRQRFNNRRFSKVDAYATADLQREHGLSFPVIKLLQDLAIHADFRDFILRTSHTDLHELTGMTRRTIKGYLVELESRGLLKMTSAPVGQRGIHIDTSPVYDLIIVENDTSNFRKTELQKDSSRTASELALSQMTHLTRENEGFGGSEAIEEGEAVHGSPEQLLYDEFSEVAHFAPESRQALIAVVERAGLDVSTNWSRAAVAAGVDGDLRAEFRRVEQRFTI